MVVPGPEEQTVTLHPAHKIIKQPKSVHRLHHLLGLAYDPVTRGTAEATHPRVVVRVNGRCHEGGIQRITAVTVPLTCERLSDCGPGKIRKDSNTVAIRNLNVEHPLDRQFNSI